MYNIPNLQKLYDWLVENKEKLQVHRQFNLVGLIASSGILETSSDYGVLTSLVESKQGWSGIIDRSFIFHSLWPNDIDQTLYRIKYVLEHGKYHPMLKSKRYELRLNEHLEPYTPTATRD